ncbi:MAG: hypothetical protein H3C34_03530 [Caldilineaceae bacterium]|nr:hypothetical protein [Caldilineaceae bacterium]
MKTYFYERTAYHLSDQPVPSCFTRLDENFDRQFASFEEAYTHPCVVMAESLCARMADVEMYAFLIEDARKRHTVDPKAEEKVAILTRSFLTGYLGAGRALLDVGAAVLAALYELPLDNANCTFANGEFWHQLVAKAPNTHRRYHPLRLFLTEFLRWSMETAHRIPPIMVVENQFGKYAPRDIKLQVIDDSHLTLAGMSQVPLQVHWIDPLRLHDRWKPQFMILCEKICVDLEKHVERAQ